MGGRADLSSDGSLTIHSYEERDAGNYECESEYGRFLSDLTTFGTYIL